jgi:hypothetical protein
MKQTFLSSRLLALTLILAIALSCSENDEQLVVQSQTDQSQMAGKSIASSKRNGRTRVANSLYDGSAGDPISLETGKAWAANYKSKNPGAIRGHYFGYEIIEQILNQAECSGIRMYYALDDKGVKQLLLVGVDFEGNDMLPLEGSTFALDGSGNIIADASFPCPDYCPDEEF